MCLESTTVINHCLVPEESTQHRTLQKQAVLQRQLFERAHSPSQPKPKSAPFKRRDSLKLRFIPSLPPRTADSTAVRFLKIKISQEKAAENSLEIRGFEVYCKAFTSFPPMKAVKPSDIPGLDFCFVYHEQKPT